MHYVIDIPRWLNIDTLAERAGVSRATVYRVRNNHPNVSEEKKDAVKSALAAIIKEQKAAQAA